MDTSSGNVILMPGTPEHTTALEQIYGKKGPPDDNGFSRVVDLLGRKIERMPVKRGSFPDNDPKPETKVLIMKDHVLDFPELWLRVCVLGPPEDTRGFSKLFSRARCQKADSIDDADVVVFTGGPDVDPRYYGETPLDGYYWGDEERDHEDIGNYLHCLEEGIPMIGVCRGAQFLAVMYGGKLHQHVEGHQGAHPLWDLSTKARLLNCSSVHHQSVRHGCPGMEIIAIDPSQKKKLSADSEGKEIVSKGPTVEAFFIRETCALGVQGHPEYADYPQYSNWFLQKVNTYINENEDLEYSLQRKRLKTDRIKEKVLLEDRKVSIPEKVK